MSSADTCVAAAVEREAGVARLGFAFSSALSRRSIDTSRSSIDSRAWRNRSPFYLTWTAPWSAVRVAGLAASFSSAPSPTDWSCEITVLRTI